MISFDNSFFFSKHGLDFENNTSYKTNINNAFKASESILDDFKSGENQILQSFTRTYQDKIRSNKNIINFSGKKKIIIGLGGSSSGAKALSFFLRDESIFFDNLDYEFFKNFFQKNKLENFIFFIVSKSGNTFETLALLNLLLLESQKLSNHDIFDSLFVICDDEDSILRNFSKKNKIKFINHNKQIGGRFSILSETGISLFLDKNIIVEDGSEKYLELLKNKNHELSPLKNAAIILTCIQELNLSIYCNLLYNYRLKHFSYWLHQLHAESLGKNGKGMTPITSICPKDHHSMMQLYLEGPKNKLFNIFSPPDEIYYDKFQNENFYNIESYTPHDLLQKQFKAVIEVFSEKKIPHRIINITDHKNPLNLIELFSYFILETILLGKMMEVNPYDQPAVQLIKNKVFKD